MIAPTTDHAAVVARLQARACAKALETARRHDQPAVRDVVNCAAADGVTGPLLAAPMTDDELAEWGARWLAHYPTPPKTDPLRNVRAELAFAGALMNRAHDIRQEARFVIGADCERGYGMCAAAQDLQDRAEAIYKRLEDWWAAEREEAGR